MGVLFIVVGALVSGTAGFAGWDPVDADGVHRYAALGLFSSGSALTPSQATVEKVHGNPLLQRSIMNALENTVTPDRVLARRQHCYLSYAALVLY